jgi:hypothetical protein
MDLVEGLVEQLEQGVGEMLGLDGGRHVASCPQDR